MAINLDDLEFFDEQFTEVEPPAGGEAPLGDFIARVHRVELGETRNGDPKLSQELVIEGGEHDGRHLFRNNTIKEDTLQWFKADLLAMGINVKDPEFRLSTFLKTGLDALLDIPLKVRVVKSKTEGGSPNVYIKGLADDAGSDDTQHSEPEPAAKAAPGKRPNPFAK